MFYVFAHEITTDDVAALKKRLDMPLTSGVIHQVDVLFQAGCLHKVNVQIFQGNFQLWPSNRDATMKGNATAVSFREFYPLAPGGAFLHALIWGDGAIEEVDVIIQIGLLPKKILQPLSFEELIAAATGL